MRCRTNRHTRCPLCREEISPGLTPSHNRWAFSAHRGYSPLDLGGDIRAAASRARGAMRARLAAIESAREEEELPTLGGAPQRFTLTDQDDF